MSAPEERNRATVERCFAGISGRDPDAIAAESDLVSVDPLPKP